MCDTLREAQAAPATPAAQTAPVSAWKDLQCKCLLAVQLLHDASTDGSYAAPCPRCDDLGTAVRFTTYDWVPGALLKTTRVWTCGCCGLDLSEEVA